MVTTTAPPLPARARRPLLLGLRALWRAGWRVRGAADWFWSGGHCGLPASAACGDWAVIEALCDLLDESERRAA